MSIEERLRNELDRTAPRSLPPAPPVEQIASIVETRRRRNSLAARAAVAVVAVGVIGGAILIARPESSPEVVATSPDTAEVSPSPTTVPLESEQPVATTAAASDEVAVVRDEELTTIDTVQLQADSTSLNIESRESAVEFAGGSGVLLTTHGSGYAGLASRFGGDAGVTAIGLVSSDGLEWSEVELAGVPAGATATTLRQYSGGYIALFSLFDVDAQRNNNYVGVSPDLIGWTLSEPLPGGATQATDVVVGSDRVAIVGVAPEPLVWTGPIGGPYERSGQILGAESVAGLVAIDAGFVAVGVSGEHGPALFDSADGTAWVPTPMSSVGFNDDSFVSAAVRGDAIILTYAETVAISNDGGQSWLSPLELSPGSIGSVASTGNTIGILGTSSLGSATVTLSNGETWSSADLELAAPDRVELLVAGDDEAVLLANVDGTLTWVVASR